MEKSPISLRSIWATAIPRLRSHPAPEPETWTSYFTNSANPLAISAPAMVRRKTCSFMPW